MKNENSFSGNSMKTTFQSERMLSGIKARHGYRDFEICENNFYNTVRTEKSRTAG
jgi:hypothetical protein